MAQLHGMTGGEGPLSYAQNSSYHRAVVDVIKLVIEEEIALKLDIKQLSPNRPMDSFWIADFGCSTGHNSFLAMQVITKAIQNKFQSDTSIINSKNPEFYVVFNDHAKNDFNTLFHSLPPERHYQALGLPVADPNSPAWNKGAVFYVGAKQEVYDAYSSQYAKDIESFLEARAQELVSGGLMALLLPAMPIKVDCSNPSYKTKTDLGLIGSSLIDIAKKGRISEEKIDSFNFPTYYTFPEELKAIIEKNGNYSIERMEIFDNPGKQKLEASPALLLPENDKSIMIFVLLKRRVE
ncbi:UNVERIFIED_CONTAM: Loganic acid O-methyltransferase [Sesamum angustifolium]|uniref:Loganic acid O-methyltransferase n=1 Tax=Sesamum angustifolium TaxID=2727405 RepID=A0AAW2RL44_9LAMI